MAHEWHWIEDVSLNSLLQSEHKSLWEFRVKGKRICITRDEDKLWAFDAKCSHQGGPLAKGFINEQCQVVCPWHRFAFDIKSGQGRNGGYFINTYELKVEDHKLWIKLPKRKSWKFW